MTMFNYEWVCTFALEKKYTLILSLTNLSKWFDSVNQRRFSSGDFQGKETVMMIMMMIMAGASLRQETYIIAE